MLEDDDDDDDDDDEFFNEFVSNFVSEANEEEEEEDQVDVDVTTPKINVVPDVNAKNPQDDVRPSDEDEAAMIDEFVSNFVESTEDAIDSESTQEINTPVAKTGMLSKSEGKEKVVTDEFQSNFGVSGEDETTDQIDEIQSRNGGFVAAAASAAPKDEDAMMG